ncbi:MAG: hypothetical protein ACP5NQ_07660 [Vulcanisaeta sp.]
MHQEVYRGNNDYIISLVERCIKLVGLTRLKRLRIDYVLDEL